MLVSLALMSFLALPPDPAGDDPSPRLPALEDDDPRTDPRLTLDAQAWYARPTGWLYITRGSRTGTATSMNTGDELGVGPRIVPVVEARYRFWDEVAFAARYTTVGVTGTSTDEEDFVFHGATFAAGRRVRAEVDFQFLDLDFQYTFNPKDAVRVTAHAGFEYWYFSAHLKTVDALAPAIDTIRHFDSGFYLVGVDVAWRAADWADLRLFAAGAHEQAQQYFWEAEASVRFQPWEHVGIIAGYHVHSIHFRQSTNRSGMTFDGPRLGFEISF